MNEQVDQSWQPNEEPPIKQVAPHGSGAGWMIGLFAGILIGAGVVYGYLSYSSSESRSAATTNESTTQPVTTTKAAEGSVSTDIADVSITADTTTTESCGTEGCFQEKFADCSPATVDIDIGLAAVRYEIFGKKENGCNMSLRYTSNPNPSWVNKDLICVWDYSKKLDDAVGDLMTKLTNKESAPCEGPLVDVLTTL